MNTPAAALDDDIRLDYYLGVALKRKRWILSAAALALVGSVAFALSLPNVYTAETLLLPPQGDSTNSMPALAAAAGIASLAGLSTPSTTADLYVTMLKSRRTIGNVVDRFRLMEVYGEETRSGAYNTFSGHLDVSVGKKDGVITAAFTDEDPTRAAAIANGIVEELKKLLVEMNLQSVGRERVFLEERLQVVRQDLLQAEDRLNGFQKKSKAIRIDDQTRAVIGAIADLRAQLASKEIQLGVLRSYQTDQSPEVKAAREAIAKIREQIAKLEAPGGRGGETGTSPDIFISSALVPDVGLQYARLLRDFQIQQTLFDMLTKQYEMAKINEARNMSTIQVLDVAEVPEIKSGPDRKKIVAVCTLAGFVLGVLSAFIPEVSRAARFSEHLAASLE